MNENDIKNIDINDVTNYNQFYNTYVMNNKNELDELNENELIKSDATECELNKTDLKDKLLYICHNCLEYCTTNRKDLVRHYKRKYKCKNYTTETNYEDAKILSLGKKFYFHFNIKDILIEDFNFITKNYNNEENHIYKNYKLVLNNKNEDNINEINEEYENNIDEINEEYEHNTNNEKEEDGNLYNEFKKQFYNEKINKYVCNKCFSKFKSKRNIVKHIISGKKCEYIKKINKLLNK